MYEVKISFDVAVNIEDVGKIEDFLKNANIEDFLKDAFSINHLFEICNEVNIITDLGD